MQMSDNEIVRTYNDAKNKKEQIQILADLNLCEYNDIVDVLAKFGINEEKKREIKKVEKEPEKKPVKKAAKKPENSVTEENKAAVEDTTNEDTKMEPIKITVLPTMPSTVLNILTKRMIACQNAIDKNTQELKEINEFLGGFENEAVD